MLTHCWRVPLAAVSLRTMKGAFQLDGISVTNFAGHPLSRIITYFLSLLSVICLNVAGKSLAILCSLLAWQQKKKEEIQKAAKATAETLQSRAIEQGEYKMVSISLDVLTFFE